MHSFFGGLYNWSIAIFVIIVVFIFIKLYIEYTKTSRQGASIGGKSSSSGLLNNYK